jgi:diguanylate cyclase (GGDEF)-like protein
VELFRGIEPEQLVEYAPLCQLVRTVPGYVFYPAGRFNTRLFVVVEGQLRLYAAQKERRPRAIVDIGQSCGLSEALGMSPAEHSLIATEETRVVAIELTVLNKLVARSHVFAQNYAELMASYTRGDHCLTLSRGGKTAASRGGYIDPATLLHNQHWLDTMFPRLVERARKDGKPLSLVALRVDRLDAIDRESGVVLSPFMLEVVGRLMVEHSRPTDLHVIDASHRLLSVLPDTTLEGARALAGRIRDEVKKVSAVDELPLPPMTLSVGIVALGTEETPEALLERAEGLVLKSAAAGGDALHE